MSAHDDALDVSLVSCGAAVRGALRRSRGQRFDRAHGSLNYPSLRGRANERTQMDRLRSNQQTARNVTTEVKGSYSNASALLSDLLADYDIRLRPGFGGEILFGRDVITAAPLSINTSDVIRCSYSIFWKNVLLEEAKRRLSK
ncbi:hypothetical protein KIN20_004188 [Parelaphostrongylus tenuis]|uniref:Uncharacterized protein n=1 Tax=Parelaphostrongylus tenuis TaxID=148309 RepID=A0AAD5LYF1_PARTN|nr:hypothetical protein KIN20_004188 [Parelaphostrongylus tenuis]